MTISFEQVKELYLVKAFSLIGPCEKKLILGVAYPLLRYQEQYNLAEARCLSLSMKFAI